MDFIKRDITRRLEDGSEKSLANLALLDDEDEENDLDADNDTMLANHCYHLSWAVFKHLPSMYHSHLNHNFKRQMHVYKT